MTQEIKIDPLWDDNPINITKEVNFIWSIANKLRGPYSSDKYRDVIIPMTIIRRFECALAPTKNRVVEEYEKAPGRPAIYFCKISGYSFYHTSHFSLERLLDDPDNIAENFKAYLEGFSTCGSMGSMRWKRFSRLTRTIVYFLSFGEGLYGCYLHGI